MFVILALSRQEQEDNRDFDPNFFYIRNSGASRTIGWNIVSKTKQINKVTKKQSQLGCVALRISVSPKQDKTIDGSVYYEVMQSMEKEIWIPRFPERRLIHRI